MPELCPEQTAEGIPWPGDAQPMTHARANALVDQTPVYLDDRFLQKYEQSAFYDSTPAHVWGQGTAALHTEGSGVLLNAGGSDEIWSKCQCRSCNSRSRIARSCLRDHSPLIRPTWRMWT